MFAFRRSTAFFPRSRVMSDPPDRYPNGGPLMRTRLCPLRFIRVFLVVAALLACVACADAGGGTRHCVTKTGAGSRNGDGWANAYGEAEFPAAILSANEGDEFWVAKGAYRPVIPAGVPTSDDMRASFVLKDGVALYGGFAGAEAASADRNPAANVTALTGDLADDDTNKVNGVTLSADRIVGTNSLCVVRASDDIGAATVLDGFSVTAAKFVEDEKGSAGGGRNVPDGRTKELSDAAGMISSGGSPTVNDCVFAGNSGLDGGGMSVWGGSPTVTNCAFSGNSAVEDGGGIFASDTVGLTVRNCTFSGNSVAEHGGGLCSTGGSPVVTDCVFTGNGAGTAGKLSNGVQPRGTAGRLGGGMYVQGDAPSVTGCAFSGNNAADEGGGLCVNDSEPTVADCVFSGNTAESGGGLAAVNDGDPLVSRCIFYGNTADSGGGLAAANNSDPTVTDCTFTGNTAGYGGGMSTGESGGNAWVTRCTFDGNTAVGIGPKVGGGGGMSTAGDPRVWNCTFSNNAASEGGGIFNDADGLLLLFCTFTGNTADSGGGLYNYEADDGDYGPQVKNCIFWGNPGGEIYNYETPNAVVTYCVIRSPDIAGKADSSPAVIITADPLLGPLAWNGGATRTFALRPGSSAIDAGTNAITPKTGRAKGLVISDDQRGVSRDVSPDIGAYEYWERKILTVHVEGAGSAAVDPAGSAVGPTDDCRSYVAGTSVTLTASPDAGSLFVGWSGDVSGSAATTTLTVSPDRYAKAVFATERIIAASAGAGGTIAPSGNVPVPDGANQTFTVTPNAGYEIANVVADGIPVEAVGTYTFTDVRANHTIEATFTANPTPTLKPIPSATPTPAPSATPTPTPSVTPTPTTAPYPTPDPDIPLPTVTLKLTLLAGGVIVLGPVEVTDPDAIASLLSSAALWAQLLEADPDAILSGNYNMDLVKFFSLLAKLDAGVTDLTLLLDVTIDGAPSGYGSQVFLLMRTFDSEGKPTGYVVVPQNEGATVFRKAAGAETWRVTVSDGGNTDGDGKQDGYVAPQIAAVVAVFPLAATVTPTAGSTGSGGGCTLPALPGAASGAFLAALLLAPLLFARRR